ncbi:recombinase RecF [Rickettsia conorii subsp. heilongjiangensis]|uniref:Recombinase RecF n=1 Tax=Rickettsia conorii subsp. heilongjiangensis TaxID=226665 RepID=A0AAD1GJC8_RICCR|nr:recombinase RecF [Rickettsia conorii subsp. heilongjiangensis]BBM93125.1 recombinase RecF [Rickettsia conorii subsp. heilongjiangensis]BBM94334.1 recombinase RecF [Rickettsia conorii subsp. heilongjiangensis]BBM95543.1 recombinase RecF [Rickettsia conorii subsp. heilongjiangensis]
MATSSYKYSGTHVLSIRSVPRLVDSLHFLKLSFVYTTLYLFEVYTWNITYNLKI